MTSWPTMNWTAGQAAVPEAILRAQARPVLAHTDPAFVDLFARTTDLLQRVYATTHDAVIFHDAA